MCKHYYTYTKAVDRRSFFVNGIYLIFRGDSLFISHFLTHSLTQDLVKPFIISAFPFILHIITNCSIHSHYPFLSDPYQILLNQFFDILSFPVNSFGNQNDFNPIYTFSHSILSNSILANHVLFNSLLFIKSLSKFRFSNPNLFNPI